jgi:hypothetical protein
LVSAVSPIANDSSTIGGARQQLLAVQASFRVETDHLVLQRREQGSGVCLGLQEARHQKRIVREATHRFGLD